MRLQNDEGTPVDPIPFLVAVGLAFLILYSFGPGYLLAVGVELRGALGITTAAFTSSVGVAYHQLVRRARPEHRGEVPVAVRFQRLVYTVLIGAAIAVLLVLPLVLQ